MAIIYSKFIVEPEFDVDSYNLLRAEMNSSANKTKWALYLSGNIYEAARAFLIENSEDNSWDNEPPEEEVEEVDGFTCEECSRLHPRDPPSKHPTENAFSFHAKVHANCFLCKPCMAVVRKNEKRAHIH